MGQALDAFVKALYDDSHAIGGTVAKRFGVRAFPTLLVLDADGNEVDEVWAQDPVELVAELDRIRRGEDTLRSFRERLRASPDDVEAAAELAERLAMRRPEEAERLATEALARAAPEQRDARAALLMVQASCLAERGAFDEFLDVVDRVLTDLPDTEAAGAAGFHLANYAFEADPERMLPVLERAMRSMKDEDRAHLLETHGLLLERVLERVTRDRAERARDDGEWLNRIAWECYERGRLLPEAVGWAERAALLTNRAPHVLDTLACLLFAADRVDRAIRIQAEALLQVEDETMRVALEENMAKFYAVKKLRERRREGQGAR